MKTERSYYRNKRKQSQGEKKLKQRFLIKFLILSFILINYSAKSQTNPANWDLSVADFSFAGFASGTSTSYPLSMVGHSFLVEPTTLNYLNAASADKALVANSTSIATGSIRNEIGNGISLLNSSSNNIGAITVGLNCLGRENISINFNATQLNDGTARVNGLILQYRIGTTGTFTNVSPGANYTTLLTGLATTTVFANILLPSSCNNQGVVQVRWIYYSASGSGSRDRIGLDEISISSSNSSAAPIGVLSGNGSICNVNDSVNIAVAVSGPAGPYTLVYSDGTSNFTILNYASGTSIAVAPIVPTTYSIVSINGSTIGHSGSANVLIGSISSSSESITALAPFIWTANGVSYTTSGTYTATLTNSSGCDSNLTLNLTISAYTGVMTGNGGVCFPGATADISVTVLGGVGPYNLVYTDGTSNFSINAYNSGDLILVAPLMPTIYSIVSIDGSTVGHSGSATISIVSATSSSTTVVGAAPYLWTTNGLSYLASGTYMDTLVNSAGCDSVITLNLTIVPNSSNVLHDLSISDFVFSGFASGTTTAYPTSLGGFVFSAERNVTSYLDTTLSERVLADNSGLANSGSIRNEVGNGLSLLNSGSNHIGAIKIGLNSIGRQNILVSYTAAQLSDAARTNGLILQYRVGLIGNFTNVSPSTDYITTAIGSLAPAISYTNIALPSVCDNQAVVQVRWVYYHVAGTGSRDRIALDEINITSTTLTPSQVNLTVTMFIEGYYDATSAPAAMFPALYNNDQLNGGSTVAANAVDSVTIELVDGSFATTFSTKGLLLTDGSLSVTFPSSAISGAYYIRVIHKNSLNLWSSALVTMNPITGYNFSTSLTSAATDGSNAPMSTLAAGLYGLYSGDLNKDGFIDNFDYPNFTSDLDDSAYNFLFFLASDLNGDGFVDSFDYPMYSFNNGLGVYEQYP